MTFKYLTLLMVAAISVVGFTACETTTNTNVANANRANMNANANTIVVVNSNANMMSNANRWNANITREEYERNRADYEKERGSSNIGQGANDMWLWVKTRSSLMAADDLRDSTINVDVVNDVVTLRGSVETAAQKASAERVAKGIEGVKSVKNELKVAPEDSMTNQMTTGNSAGSNSNTNRR